MKKKSSSLLFVLGILLLMGSCKKNNDVANPDALISPADANALTRVLVLPNGTQNLAGLPPSSTGGSLAPQITSPFTQLLSSNGGTIPLLYNYLNLTGSIAGFYVQVAGASSYFNVPYNNSLGGNGQLQLPVTIPTNVDSGRFCLALCVYDNNNRVSNIVRICVDVLRLGTGALQVSLSWNNDSDQDLYVTDPSGETISYTNKQSNSGGELDRDDTDGYGPENIYWLNTAPDGTYQVKVDDYDNVPAGTTCYVTINSPGKSKSFTVRTQSSSTVNVATITKNGTNYNY
jgi:hypothetical protein